MKRRLIALLVLSLGIQIPLAVASKQKKVKFNGYVEWRNDHLLIVDGQRVLVADTTKVKLRGHVTSLMDVPLGYEANDNKALNFFFGSHSSSLDRAKKLEREIVLNYSADPAIVPRH
jgi:hypothetical protein